MCCGVEEGGDCVGEGDCVVVWKEGVTVLWCGRRGNCCDVEGGGDCGVDGGGDCVVVWMEGMIGVDGRDDCVVGGRG